jgi:hypothetical protein
MAMIMVYLSEGMEIESGNIKVSWRRGTLDAIKARSHLSPIMESGVYVDEADIGAEIPGFTAVDFKPATGPYAVVI